MFFCAQPFCLESGLSLIKKSLKKKQIKKKWRQFFFFFLTQGFQSFKRFWKAAPFHHSREPNLRRKGEVSSAAVHGTFLFHCFNSEIIYPTNKTQFTANRNLNDSIIILPKKEKNNNLNSLRSNAFLPQTGQRSRFWPADWHDHINALRNRHTADVNIMVKRNNCVFQFHNSGQVCFCGTNRFK